ncbi:SDR family oxidoreductase, partial [bacterium]
GEVAVLGTQIERVRADVSDANQVRSYVDAAQRAFGRIDGLFNNAGIDGKLGSIETYDETEFDRIIATNLRSIFLGLRYVIPVMLAQGGGAVVNTGSIASERGLAGACAYNASKHGILGLTRTAAADTASRGIRVNAVMPGVIETPLLEAMLETMFNGDVDAGKKTLGKVAPQERIGKPREIGEAVAFLLSTAASFVNGAAWAIDGGALCTIRH